MGKAGAAASEEPTRVERAVRDRAGDADADLDERDLGSAAETKVAPSSHEARDGQSPLEAKTSLSTLLIGAVIGEGGMGIVREAVQLALARAVAVKSLHAGATEADADTMLREAWVTGFLEHPGVVPIYDIAKGPSGPVVVMRRIEGETWHARLTDESWANARGARDLLEQNLQVLVRVCEIVEFAHAKGVIHRDIKPRNVMIGAFGEVYLLDWGLALALRGVAAERLPTGTATRQIAGTLSYAAPEMVGLIDAPLSERTDIYLLGAVLHEIVTGERPHAKNAPPETMRSIDESPPELPAHVSPRVAAIIRAAMQRLPSDRYETVSRLRLDILEYLRSRDSDHLATSAHAILEKLREACAADAPERAIHLLHAECRFRYREALRTWAGNSVAERGLVAAETMVIERELSRDALRAGALLEQADGIDETLAARVREAAEAQREEEARRAQMAREADSDTARRPRAIAFAVLGSIWAITVPLGDHVGPVTNTRFAIGSAFQLVLLTGISALVPGAIKTTYNRRLLGAIAVAAVAQVALFATANLLGISVEVSRTLQIAIWAVGGSLVTLLFDRRCWPMTLAATVGFFIAVAHPSLRSTMATIAALTAASNMAVMGGVRRTLC